VAIENFYLTPTALPIVEGSKKMPVWKKKDKFQVAVVEGRYASGKPKYRRETVDTEEQAHLREKELLKELNFRQTIFQLSIAFHQMITNQISEFY